MDDYISRQAAIDAIVNCTNCGDEKTLRAYVAKHSLDNGWTGGVLEAIDAIENLPSAQSEPSEITEEQAILHLQSTGWMQNHDREMYESGLRERLADDSEDYNSLIPCGDTISRQAAIDVADAVWSVTGDKNVAKVWDQIKDLPSAQPEKRTEERTETHACDCISRQAAIDAVYKCADIFVGDMPVMVVKADAYEALAQLPSAQPERQKGEWIEISSISHTYKCSECGRLLVNITDGKNNVAKNYPYCHCGADMRGEQDDKCRQV